MKHHPVFAARTHVRTRGLAAVLCVFAAAGLTQVGPAAAQGATSPAVTSATGDPYKACMDGTSSEDRATCMKEAGAAKAEAQRGQLTNANPSYDRNALERCDALPAAEKEPCRLRILGAGTTSGSVAGGGVLREVIIQNPVPANASGASSGASTTSSGSASGSAPR